MKIAFPLCQLILVKIHQEALEGHLEDRRRTYKYEKENMQIRAEVGEIEKIKQKFITHEIWFFININKIFKPLAQLTKNKRESKRNFI